MVTILEGKSLHHRYPGPVDALLDVDMRVDANELVVVAGPNASGKTTLLRVLAGVLCPTGGQVRVGGESLKDFSLKARARRIALVPQSLSVLPDITVERFVATGRYAVEERWTGMSKQSRVVVGGALDATDIGKLGDRRLCDLSGGQRQRALIARAVAQEAAILLVDEPTNALDPEHQLAVFDLLASLCTDGRAAIVVTHDLNLASQFADRIALLHGGKIAAIGTPGEVLQDAVLSPIYGSDLYFGTMPSPDGRPFVLPWMCKKTGNSSP